LTYDDSAVQSGATYTYAATSVDSNNVESAYSNVANATIP
jgi:fibronectin type 3 domain-containing protein